MPQWIDIDQNTPEWMALRVGRVGGSSIACIMAHYGNELGEPAKRLALRIALEQLDGIDRSDDYTNKHFDRGHAEEPDAIELYEKTFFCTVDKGGYFTEGTLLGISPDGRVFDDGLVEVKSRIYPVFKEARLRGSYDPSDKWQCFLNLKVSGRKWLDYIEYCSKWLNGPSLLTTRIYAADLTKEFEQIDSRLSEFALLVRAEKEAAQK